MKVCSLSSSLEVLESRIAPANITAAAIDGELVIEASRKSFGVHVDVVQTGPDAFNVLEIGELVASFADITALRLKGSGTTDVLRVDMLSDPTSRFTGDVSVHHGGGPEDTIDIRDGDFGGNLRIDATHMTKVTTAPGTTVAGKFHLHSTSFGAQTRLEGSFGDVRITSPGFVVLGDFIAAGDVSAEARPRSHCFVSAEPGAQIDGDFTIDRPGLRFVTLELTGLTIGGAADFSFGGGNHKVTLTDCSIGGGLQLQLGKLNDHIVLAGTQVQGPVEITLGGGTNKLEVTGDASFGGAVTITATRAATSNTLTLADSTITGELNVRLPGGSNGFAVSASDLLGGVIFDGGGQALSFTTDAATTIAGNLHVTGSDGANTVSIGQAGYFLSIRYIGGAGMDDFRVAGSGGDFLTIEANLGPGQDRAHITCADFGSATIDGGTAQDTLLDIDRYVAMGGTYRRFEHLVLS